MPVKTGGATGLPVAGGDLRGARRDVGVTVHDFKEPARSDAARRETLMRITRHTATALQLEDSGRRLMTIGSLALAVAIGIGVLAWRDGKTGAALIVVAVFGTVGLICLRRARAAVHRMDLQRGTLTIETTPVIAFGPSTRETTTYPLSNLMDLTLEEMSPPENGRHTRVFRPVYVFRDGLRVPLMPHYTAFKGWQQALQTTVRAMLADDAVQRERS